MNHPPCVATPSGGPFGETVFERTLHTWVERFRAPRWHGCHVEGWAFEGRDARHAAEQELARSGVHARFHSAYKPLVQHAIDQRWEARQLAGLRIRYPVLPVAPARRFALEAYPLGRLLAHGAMELVPRDDAEPWYEVQCLWQDGRSTHERIFAPNRSHVDSTGAAALSPTGWLRVGTRPGTADVIDAAVTTEYEHLYAVAMQALRTHAWPQQEPYFERLDLRVDLPGFEQPLPWAGETISTLEAMHEDLYFSLLEFFQQHSGREPGDRRLQPGQIVPDVRLGDTPRLRIALVSFSAPAQEASAAPAPFRAGQDAPQALHLQQSAMPPERIVQALHGWPAQRFSAPTRQGRKVWGQYHAGTQHPVFISAGQHANETSGVVGALRAAEVLRAQPGAHFALIALENPDGYALQRELCAHHPEHIQHAARYTALGDDIEYRDRPPLLERQARQTALALSGAQLHVNLHGYPAHEWTRPLSGYVPRGFEQWMLPKGFFLILRHHAGWQAPARALLEAVCAELADLPGLREFNERQRSLYAAHAGAFPHEIVQGIACMQAETSHDAPVTLITEFPDETVYGPAFQFAHTVQMVTVLAAQRAWQGIVPTGSTANA